MLQRQGVDPFLPGPSGNVAAREHRAAERAHLLATIPGLAAAEARLVKRIGMVEDDALVGALMVEWQPPKQIGRGQSIAWPSWRVSS